MTRKNILKFVLATFSVLAASMLTTTASAQGLLGGGDPLGLGAGMGAQEAKVEVSAHFAAQQNGNRGRLFVTATIAKDYHIYAITQKPGGPAATKLKVDPSQQFQLTGPFVAHDPPKIHFDELWGKLALEEHYGKVTWSAPVQFAEGVDPQQVKIKGLADMQVCDPGTCTPIAIPFTAAFDPHAELLSGEYQAEGSNVVIRGHMEPATAKPGDRVRLVLAAEPEGEWHVYSLADKDPDIIGEGKPTLIDLDVPAGWEVGMTTSNKLAKTAEGGDYYEGAVVWTTEITLPQDLPAGRHELSGLIGYQACTSTGCQAPLGARFVASIDVQSGAQAEGKSPLDFQAAKYGEVAQAKLKRAEAAKGAAVTPGIGKRPEPASITTILLTLPVAFLGGLILNLMPCVLPVIGLKIVSFVEQAGHDRGQVLKLNLWYTAGVLTVFMGLATLAVGMSLSWGEQFQSSTFNLVLIAILFAMALSFLGVWEIPLPGFVGSGKANELAAKEGPAGAFFKGVLSTVLATPCSGPALGAVFALTLGQPAPVTYLLFATIGLGMASPYLLIGLVPHLGRLIPKPGLWMEAFKQAMGFVLLAAVIVMFKFFLKPEMFVPALGLMLGVGIGCWWLGRTPLYAGAAKLAKAWVIAGVLIAVVGGGAYSLLTPRVSVIAWQPFSRARLTELTASGKTVMIDFTANWCLTCQWNYARAIDTQEVRNKLQENDVVPLLADWTDRDDEIKKMLTELGSNSIPLLAIFPSENPSEPILLRDVVTRQQVIEALEAAGPSGDGQVPAPALATSAPNTRPH